MTARKRHVLKGADRDRARSLAARLYPQLSLDAVAEHLKTAQVVQRPDGTLTGVHVARNTVAALLREAGVPIRAPHRTRRAKAGGGEA
jgi:hypothetical protein